MKRLVVLFAGFGLVLLGTVGFAVTTASAGTKGARTRAASAAVQEALQCEISGSDEDRARLLQSALEQEPDYPPALWQSGHVRHQNKWLRFDELPELLADDHRLAEYRRRRAESPDTVDAQLALAQWCSKQKLAEQARAHLTAVLEIDPEHPQARQLLGYRKVDGVWLSQEEIQQAAVRAQQMETGLQQWKPKLEEILRGVEHRSQRQQEAAAKRLEAIDDPTAIPAVELVLSMHAEQTALLAVDVLDRLSGPDAALALARQAVLSPWEPVRDAAVQALRKRDPVLYVPPLLCALSTPVQTRAELYRAPSGRLMYRHALYREGQERAQLAVFETEYLLTVLQADVDLETGAPAFGNTYDIRRNLLAAARQQDIARRAQALEANVAQQNALIHRLNERICWVLSHATGHNLPVDPQAWWRWWNDYNGVVTAGPKPVGQANYHDTVRYDDPYRQFDIYQTGDTQLIVHPGGMSVVRWRHSCLLAGTLVWTDSGPVPIERIRVGDLVLSQHAETGELAYKPVLKTTQRPPIRMLKVVFGDKALQCDDGHPFWVPGEGWVQACDLKQGTKVHAVDRTAEVRSVHPTGTEQLHNLVVADFHTYFVTEAKILTHDNTIRESTSALVPGLVNR